jgi:serine protease AprX
MKKLIIVFLLLSGVASWSQEDAWVYFANKPNSAAFLSNPLTMLTQRSLDRRTTQNIALDIKDVPVHQPYIDQVEAANGITIYAKSKWLNCVHVRGNYDDVQALSALAFVDHIEYANRNLNTGNRKASQKRVKPFHKTMETETAFNYGTSLNQIQMLNGVTLHEQNYTGSGKIIAVMDGGFPGVNTASTFSRLRDNGQILGGYDFVNRSEEFYTGISHGTMVLSTMGGYKNNQLVGTAPDAQYYLFITEDGDNEGPLELSLWVEAAEEADRLGVDVINTSLGYTQFDNPDYDFTYEDMDGQVSFASRGLDIAYSRGMICVIAAGNEGNSDWHYISSPADATHALTIGAVNASENPAGFSSYGPSADGRIKPDVAAQGQQSVISGTSGTVGTGNGTSFASPILAGMVASFWQALPGKTNEEIMQLIKESASIYNNPNDRIGYGIPNFGQALATALGTQQFATDNTRFTVYPNPIHDQMTIAFPDNYEYANLSLYNAIGQKVMEQPVSSGNPTIFLNTLQSGMYLYKIQTQTFSQSGKLVKE